MIECVLCVLLTMNAAAVCNSSAVREKDATATLKQEAKQERLKIIAQSFRRLGGNDFIPPCFGTCVGPTDVIKKEYYYQGIDNSKTIKKLKKEYQEAAVQKKEETDEKKRKKPEEKKINNKKEFHVGKKNKTNLSDFFVRESKKPKNDFSTNKVLAKSVKSDSHRKFVFGESSSFPFYRDEFSDCYWRYTSNGLVCSTKDELKSNVDPSIQVAYDQRKISDFYPADFTPPECAKLHKHHATGTTYCLGKGVKPSELENLRFQRPLHMFLKLKDDPNYIEWLVENHNARMKGALLIPPFPLDGQ